MNLLRRTIERYKEHCSQKYEMLLLLDKIRLTDVPEWLRRDYQRCFGIYVTAFRIDRGTSRARYEDDLLNLDVEIILVETMGDHILAEMLRHIKDSMEAGLELCKKP